MLGTDVLEGIFEVKVEDFGPWVSPGCALALGTGAPHWPPPGSKLMVRFVYFCRLRVASAVVSGAAGIFYFAVLIPK